MYIDEKLIKILEPHLGETIDVSYAISLVKTITEEYGKVNTPDVVSTLCECGGNKQYNFKTNGIMREIKFRGLRLKKDYNSSFHDSKFKFGNLLNNQTIGEVGSNLDSYEYADVIPETVGQFTGLKDKNGKDIYEGDVIYSPQHNPEKMEVKFIEGGFCMDLGGANCPIDINHFYSSSGVKIEVIGNIHEQMN